MNTIPIAHCRARKTIDGVRKAKDAEPTKPLKYRVHRRPCACTRTTNVI